jgi:hypothetical protein
MKYNQLYADVRIASKSGNQISGFCPFHDDRNPSFSYNLTTGLFKCFSGCGEGDAADYAKLKGLDPKPYYKGSIHKPSNSCNGFKRANMEPKKVSVALELNNADKEKALEYHKYLMDNYESLIGSWPIDKETIKKLYIGYDTEAKQFTFLFRGIEDKAFNLQHHHGKCIKGHELGRLYPGHLLKEYNPELPLIFAEGCKDVATLIHKRFNAVTCGAGAKTIPKDLYALNSFKVIILLFDKDKTGQEGSYALAKEMNKQLPNSKVLIAKWGNDKPDKWDVSDHFAQGIDEGDLLDEFDQILNNAKEYTPQKSKKGYKVVRLIDAFEMDIEKPKMIVEDILNERGNTLIAAEDNVGKSMMANQLGLCIATGTDFLGYRVPKPRKVLLVQHEMENGEQIDRLRKQSALYFKVHPELIEQNVKLHLIEDGENLAIVDQFDVLDITLKENPDIEVVVFDNIGQSTNVEMTKPDAIRNELKRLKALCRIHSVAFILVAHHVKIDWAKEMDLTKRQIQGGKPITDWADNIIQLHTSSMNPNLVLFKITKIRSIHNNEGHSTKLLNQAVWFNQDNDLLFNKMFAVSNWEGHFTALDKHERELDFVKELNDYPQPFETNDAMNVGDKMNISISTIKGYWLPKLCKWEWLNKEGHGKYSVNKETLQFLISEELNY